MKIILGLFQIFVENSRRYSQVKVHHRYQRHQWQICHRYQQQQLQNCRRYQRHQRQILPPVPLVLLIPVANLPPMSINIRLLTTYSELEGKYLCTVYANSTTKGVVIRTRTGS
jgi:hypothetical protein